MCMKKNMKFRLVIILALLMALPLKAQDKKNMFNPVNYTVTSLAIAPDARGGALGDLGAATEADANSQYVLESVHRIRLGYASWSTIFTWPILQASIVLATIVPCLLHCVSSR